MCGRARRPHGRNSATGRVYTASCALYRIVAHTQAVDWRFSNPSAPPFGRCRDSHIPVFVVTLLSCVLVVVVVVVMALTAAM